MKYKKIGYDQRRIDAGNKYFNSERFSELIFSLETYKKKQKGRDKCCYQCDTSVPDRLSEARMHTNCKNTSVVN